MYFDGLEKVPQGLCVCVFDGSDRIRHVFWPYRDEQHPARPAEVPAALQTFMDDLSRRIG